jgi:hypothetical protein
VATEAGIRTTTLGLLRRYRLGGRYPPSLVQSAGFEPARAFAHGDLNAACLPNSNTTVYANHAESKSAACSQRIVSGNVIYV